MRDVYTLMFKLCHALPAEVAKQPPILLLRLLDELRGEDEETEIPDNLKFLYGY